MASDTVSLERVVSHILDFKNVFTVLIRIFFALDAIANLRASALEMTSKVSSKFSSDRIEKRQMTMSCSSELMALTSVCSVTCFDEYAVSYTHLTLPTILLV